MTLDNVQQRLGVGQVLHDRAKRRTEFGPPWLTVTYHALPTAGARHRQTPNRYPGGPRPRGATTTSQRDCDDGSKHRRPTHALRDEGKLTRDFCRRRPAVFLDYDGALSPIADYPEDAVISQSMRKP
jgi:hypothetical protein